MRLICLVLCAVVATAMSEATGSSDAILGQFVHQGFIQDSYGAHVCGVWIHSKRWAIAPAYYMQGRSLWNTFAVFGTVLNNQGGSRYPIAEIRSHPNFNANTLDNNLALLFIEDGIEWYTYVHPIPMGTEYTRGGVIATVAGWTGDENQMQYVSQRTMTNEDCQMRHAPENRDRITERVICVDNTENVGGCFSHTGAAGSALISGGFVIGSLSWGVNCTEDHYPDVYTRVSYYQSWIYSVVGEYDLGLD